jgi:hypothetical protein
LPERLPLGYDRQQVKKYGGEQKGDGQVVEGGVEARPVVAEHGFSEGVGGTFCRDNNKSPHPPPGPSLR